MYSNVFVSCKNRWERLQVLKLERVSILTCRFWYLHSIWTGEHKLIATQAEREMLTCGKLILEKSMGLSGGESRGLHVSFTIDGLHLEHYSKKQILLKNYISKWYWTVWQQLSLEILNLLCLGAQAILTGGWVGLDLGDRRLELKEKIQARACCVIMPVMRSVRAQSLKVTIFICCPLSSSFDKGALFFFPEKVSRQMSLLNSWGWLSPP